MQGEKRRFSHAIVFALLALLIHAGLVIPLLDLILSMEPDDEGFAPLEVDIWNETAALEEEKTPEEELEEYEPEEEIPDGMVVRAPKSPNDKRPEETSFLSEHNSTVDEETRSRSRAPGEESYTSETATTGTGKEAQTIPGGMKAEMHGAAPSPSDLQQAEGGEIAAAVQAPPSLEDVNLEPSMQAMSRAIAGSGLDHLEGIIDGDATAINSKAWDYASFFNRVKRKVELYWKPGAEYRRRDPYGNIYGFKDRVTILLVILKPDGSLHNLHVMEPSGAPFLDDEAYDAVKQASPFPNVPAGLKDKNDGLVKFTFHFMVEVGEQPILRMRRYR